MPDSTCSVAVCERRAKARGLCGAHYTRWNRYGDAEYVPPRTQKLLERQQSDVRTCTKCNERKNVTEFSRDTTRPCGYRPQCKLCASAVTKDWRARNEDHVRRFQAQYRKENQAARAAYRATYLPEWKRANPERLRDYTHRRRALKAASVSSAINYDDLWHACGGSCPDCGCVIERNAPWPTEAFASIDHIIPLSKGGAHEQANLRYTCLPCNLKKGAKIVS